MRIQMTAAVPWQAIRSRLAERLTDRGFVLRTTFDLRLARRSLKNGRGAVCPLHRSRGCTCQYLVLYISHGEDAASVVVLHGHDRTTKIALISSPGEKLDQELAAEVYGAITTPRQTAGGARRPAARPSAGNRAPAGVTTKQVTKQVWKHLQEEEHE